MNQSFLRIPELPEPARPMQGWAPLQPLPPRQRLGYLQHVNSIRCAASMAGFEAGQDYAIETSCIQLIRWSQKLNVSGGLDQVELTGPEMAFHITNNDGVKICFAHKPERANVSDATVVHHSLETLLAHFNPPHVRSMTDLFPEAHARLQGRLLELEQWIQVGKPDFKLADYQREDLPAGALRDGILLGWETGLGKSLGLFLWMLLKVGWNFTARGIAPQKPALLVTLGDLASGTIDEARRYLSLDTVLVEKAADLRRLCERPALYVTSYQKLLKADLLSRCREFETVLVDEGTKIKSADSQIGMALRSLNPKFRALATATPIKNRLPDLFWLLWWVAGGRKEKHPGFQFGSDAAEVERFNWTYLVQSSNQTREIAARHEGKTHKYRRATAQACNLPKLRTITAPLILRRRKADVAGIVHRHHTRVIVPLSREQAALYARIIAHDYRDANGNVAVGSKLQALRQAAACPNRPGLPHHTQSDYHPKIAACLSLIAELRPKPVIVFAPFLEALDSVSRRLTMAGVPHCALDGRVSQSDRAAAVKRFRARPTILLASDASMAYGHNIPECSNLITLGKDWAMDVEEQAASRIHRFDSPRDITVHDLIAEGTIDWTVQLLLDEKKATAAESLDGGEGASEHEEIDLHQLLVDCVHDFNTRQGLAVDDALLLSEWPALCEKLRIN